MVLVGCRSSGAVYPTRVPPAQEQGLRWLMREQEKSGPLAGGWDPVKWGGQNYPCGVSGAALLAFLGDGCTDKGPREFAETVRTAIDFLMKQQQKFDKVPGQKGYFGEGMYSQGVCTLALGEAYGMTGSEKVKEAAQAGLDYILHVQPPTGGFGLYGPGCDMNVSAVQLLAIKAGIDVGLTVPEVSRARAEAFLRSSAMRPDYHATCGVPPAWTEKDGAVVRVPGVDPEASVDCESPCSDRMTAASLAARLLLGHSRRDPECVGQADWLVNSKYYGSDASHNDLYYIYYMSQAMFEMGDLWSKKYWSKWNKNFQAPLRALQEKTGPNKGSWPPKADSRLGGYGGRVLTTAVASLTLEVYWIYRMPPPVMRKKGSPDKSP